MIQINDGNFVKIISDGEYVIVNGKTYRTPKKKLFGFGNTMSIIDNRVYINGYELVNGKWKVTLFSIFHLFF